MNKHSPTGQGALEYLLLVGGAVLIGSVVISLVFTVGGSGNEVVSHRSGEVLNALEGGLGGDGGPTGPSCVVFEDYFTLNDGDPPEYHKVEYYNFPSGQPTNLLSSTDCIGAIFVCEGFHLRWYSYYDPNGHCGLICHSTGTVNFTIDNGTETANCSHNFS